MTNNPTKENILGTEKVSKLLIKFATPSVIAMLISSLYNIVDQIFIGNYVGPIGNAATNVAFPITTVCIAISVLFGVGGSSYFSIELGRGRNQEAADSIGTSLITATALSVLYALVAGFFAPQMLTLFGGSGDTLEYSIRYCNYLVYGIPFLVIGNVLSNFIRADGSPRFSMVCMVVGAVVNIVLDAILVPYGGVEWGMQGAALATSISQFVSFAIAVLYLKKFKSVEFHLTKIKYSFRRALRIASLGMSHCVNQLAILVVQITMNNQLDTYGAIEFSKELAYIPQAAFGVVIKTNSILISFFVGMAQGSQPIVGYNYGADKHRRSKDTFMLSAATCFIVALVGFLIFQFAPQIIINLFGSGDAAYNDFAEKTMRIFLSMIMLTGVQMTISNYFSAIGKPTLGIILSLCRQILIFVPLMWILPTFLGLNGVLYAAPISDFTSCVLAVILVIKEFQNAGYKKQ